MIAITSNEPVKEYVPNTNEIGDYKMAVDLSKKHGRSKGYYYNIFHYGKPVSKEKKIDLMNKIKNLQK